MTSSLRRNPIVRAVALLALALGFFAVAPGTVGAADAERCVFDADHPEKYGEAASITITANPSQLRPGETTTITGSGFPENCTVQIDVAGETYTVTTDDDGTFTLEWTVPAGTQPGNIQVVASITGLTTTTTLTILGADDGPTTTTPDAVGPGISDAGPDRTGGTGTGILPKTGSQILPFLGAGVGLLVLGSLLVLANRKRGATV